MFGERYGLVITNGDLRRGIAEQFDLGAALVNLSENTSVADPYTGAKWADRVKDTVHLDGDMIKHIRIEVRVDASTSSDTSRVVEWFEDELGTEDETGNYVVSYPELQMFTSLATLSHCKMSWMV